MVSECPRPSNSWKSVMASDFSYSPWVAFADTKGTVWSAVPAVISSGPRVPLAVSTLAGELPEKFATAAWNSGLPGDGMDHCAQSSSDSSCGQGVAEPVAPLRFGQPLGASPVERVAEHGKGRAQLGDRKRLDALDRAGSIAIAAAALFCPNSFWAMRPPNESRSPPAGCRTVRGCARNARSIRRCRSPLGRRG